MFISVLKAFFVQMWQSGVEASKRIEELKSGVPLGETVVIKDAQEAQTKVDKILEAAKKEIVIITSSQSINRLAEGNSLSKFFKDDLKIRLMASIDLDNLEPAQKLASHYEVKHVPISYMIMMLVDNKHLFMFKNPPLSDAGVDSAFYFADTFYTSDHSQIERVSEMLNDIWKRGIDISEITSQAGTKLPSVEVEKTQSVIQAVERMLQNNVTSVLIKEQHQPLGIISERDILREIVEGQKNPQKTLMGELRFTPLILLEADESIVTAMKRMAEKGFKRAAMVKGGQLIGMLTREVGTKKT
jgi:CBS domain-containing protein